MSLPIPDAPSPAVQDALSADASFEVSPLPAAALCGFALPSFSFSLSFKLPGGFSIPPAFPPAFSFPLAFDCLLNNPLEVDKGLKSGGGRVGSVPKDPDDDYDDLGPT